MKGFTLIEILIVIVIFSFIISSIVYIIILSQKTYQQGEISAEIVQNGRVILEMMSREIRQARKIVTFLPEEQIDTSEEILFQDGHAVSITEENLVQTAAEKTITLSEDASGIDNYYKDLFVKIIDGYGAGQIRKIISYDGESKLAEVESVWDAIPMDDYSVYRIDSSFYYIHYYEENNNILRKVTAFYFSGNENNFVPYNAIPPLGETLEEVVLEEPRIIGEYVSSVEFWGNRNINIFLVIEKQWKESSFSTKVFGRNL